MLISDASRTIQTWWIVRFVNWNAASQWQDFRPASSPATAISGITLAAAAR